MPGTPFFRTIAGRRVAIGAWVALLLAAAAYTALDPAHWQRHAVLMIAPALGLADQGVRLRAALRERAVIATPLR